MKLAGIRFFTRAASAKVGSNLNKGGYVPLHNFSITYERINKFAYKLNSCLTIYRKRGGGGGSIEEVSIIKKSGAKNTYCISTTDNICGGNKTTFKFLINSHRLGGKKTVV